MNAEALQFALELISGLGAKTKGGDNADDT